jgi:MmyB-like transcription regulator ligand binding domain
MQPSGLWLREPTRCCFARRSTCCVSASLRVGLAPRIANLPEWRAHLLDRLRRQVDLTADPVLADLMAELRAYPAPSGTKPKAADDDGGVAVPFRLITDAGVLSFFSTTTIFGTPIDVTLSELAIEAFFPADATTAEALRELADASSAAS